MVLPVVENSKSIVLNQWFNTINVVPDTGYDVMKEVTIVNDLPRDSIENSKVFSYNKLENSFYIHPDAGFSEMKEVNLKTTLWLAGILHRYTDRYGYPNRYSFYGFDEFKFIPKGKWEWAGFNQSSMLCSVSLVSSYDDQYENYPGMYIRISLFLWLDQFELDPHWHFVHVPDNSYVAKWFMGYDTAYQYLALCNNLGLEGETYNILEKIQTKWYIDKPSTSADPKPPAKPKISFWSCNKDFPLDYFDIPYLDGLKNLPASNARAEFFEFLDSEEISTQEITVLDENEIPLLS